LRYNFFLVILEVTVAEIFITISISDTFLDKFNNLVKNVNALNKENGGITVHKIDKNIADYTKDNNK